MQLALCSSGGLAQQGIAGICLDPIPSRPLDLRRGRDHAPDPKAQQETRQSEPRRACLIDHRDRSLQLTQLRQDRLRLPTQPTPHQFTCHLVQGTSHDRPCVHIQTDESTLNPHRDLLAIVCSTDPGLNSAPATHDNLPVRSRPAEPGTSIPSSAARAARRPVAAHRPADGRGPQRTARPLGPAVGRRPRARSASRPRRGQCPAVRRGGRPDRRGDRRLRPKGATRRRLPGVAPDESRRRGPTTW